MDKLPEAEKNEAVDSVMKDIERLLLFTDDLKAGYEAFKTIRPECPDLHVYLWNTWASDDALFPPHCWHFQSQGKKFQRDVEVKTNNCVEGYSCIFPPRLTYFRHWNMMRAWLVPGLTLEAIARILILTLREYRREAMRDAEAVASGSRQDFERLSKAGRKTAGRHSLSCVIVMLLPDAAAAAHAEKFRNAVTPASMVCALCSAWS
jgi:hypothetical protein